MELTKVRIPLQAKTPVAEKIDLQKILEQQPPKGRHQSIYPNP